jgi:D-glycero-D-manno-heptose 1,7-bisphosphate phosphatase
MYCALFLDRDGVINVDHGYVASKERWEFIPGIFDLAAEANRRGYLVIVVTNQAGIARGYYSEAQFLELMDWVRQEFAVRQAKLDAVYFCPHHPEGIGGYRKVCRCRKPAPGMLLRAASERNIDLRSSIFVGDNQTDFQASKAAGVGRFLYFGSNCDDPAITLTSLTDYDRIFGGSIESQRNR